AQRVAILRGFDEIELAQLGEAIVEHGGGHVLAALTERAEGLRPVVELPEHAQRPAAPEGVEEHHDRPARPAAARGRTHLQSLHRVSSLRYGIRSVRSCYGNSSTGGGLAMTARINPLAPPYADRLAEDFAALMPPGVPPIALFRTLAKNPRVLRRVRRGGLLDPGSITVRQREIVILRTTARA